MKCHYQNHNLIDELFTRIYLFFKLLNYLVHAACTLNRQDTYLS